MKILIAPDKFKGSLTALEVCQGIDEGLKLAGLNSTQILFPLADGGDGTADILQFHTKGTWQKLKVNNALLESIESEYVISGDGKIGIVEMARASGLAQIELGQRNVLKASSFGTGELIRHALRSGVEEIVLGIGGSATNDGGMGMATALGFQFLDENNHELRGNGENLLRIKSIIPPKTDYLKDIRVKIACDVTNPLCGKNGASAIYGPQKGATPNDIITLDQGLTHLADLIFKMTGNNYANVEGAGAAGGLGFGAMAFLGGELISGIDLIFETTQFDQKIKDASLIITGEGRIDEQTLNGKVIKGITEKAKVLNIPVYAICGSLESDPDLINNLGLTYAVSIINRAMSLQEAMDSASEAVKFQAFQLGRLFSR